MIRPSSSAVPIRNGSRFPRRKPYIGHRTRKNADPSLRFGPHRVSGDSLAASAASSDIPATSARRRSGIFDNLGTHFRTGDSTLPSALYPNKRTYRLAQPFPDSSRKRALPHPSRIFRRLRCFYCWSNFFTASEIARPSARPANCFVATPITLPMSDGALAPTCSIMAFRALSSSTPLI